MRPAGLPLLLSALFVLLAPTGCDDPGANEAQSHGGANAGHNGHDVRAGDDHNGGSPAPTNRIDVPAAVRENLGITFAKVELRAVAATVRAPGRFELLPSARREYRCPLPGRISLAVRQFQEVKEGDLLLRLDSPDWRRIQHEAVEAEGEINTAEAKLQVSQATQVETEQAIALQAERVAKLAEANVRRAELETGLAELRNKLPRLAAEVRAAEVALAEAKEHFQSKLKTLSSVVGLPVPRLLEAEAAGGDGPPSPRWRAIDFIEVRAAEAGVVENLSVTDGSWSDAAALALVTVNPLAVRFRAVALQSDLTRIRDDLPASIIPPQGGSLGGAEPIEATLKVGLAADYEQRTVELIAAPSATPPWAKAGIVASLEIVTDRTPVGTAIPAAAIVQDGLERLFFRRDPKDLDKVIRTPADLGVSDGRWVVVNSGVKAGDEVVVEGAYELKLTGVGKPQGGGHFHADGTWHADGTPEPGGKK